MVLQPAVVGSKQAVIALSSVSTPANRGSATYSLSSTGKTADSGLKQKDILDSTLPVISHCQTVTVPFSDDGRRHDKQPVSESKSQTEVSSQSQSRSQCSNSTGQHSHSRSRSRERRHHTSVLRNSGHSRNLVDKQSSTVSGKSTPLCRPDSRHSRSPAAAGRFESPDKRQSLTLRDISHRRQISDARQKYLSYGSSRLSPAVQPHRNSTSKSTVNADEPIVVIDTDDEDEVEETIESIPLPVVAPDVMLGDIPLPVPVKDMSDATTKDTGTIEIQPVEKNLDLTSVAKRGEESANEKQRSCAEEAVDCVDNVDMDLDDSSDDGCQHEENNIASVEPDCQKGRVFSTGKIVLSIGGRKQTGRDRSASTVVSSDTSSDVAWKRKLAAGLLKAPKLLTLKTELVAADDSPADESDENMASVSSTTLDVGTNADTATDTEHGVLPENPPSAPSQREECTKLNDNLSCNVQVVGKSASSSNPAAAVRTKPRRRFSDTLPENSADLPDVPPPSAPSAAALQTVKIVRAFHVILGQQCKQQSEDSTKNVVSGQNTSEPNNSVSNTSDKLTSLDDTTSAKRTIVDTGDKLNPVSGTEHRESKNPGSSSAKVQKTSESNSSRSPVSGKKNTERHRSSTSHSERRSPTSSKKKVRDHRSKSRDRNSPHSERKKQPSSSRQSHRSPDHSSSDNRQKCRSPEGKSNRSRSKAVEEHGRCSSSKGKDCSPERRLGTSREREEKERSKDESRSARKSSDDRNVKNDNRSSGSNCDKVLKDTGVLSSDSVHRRSPRRRSPEDKRRGEVKRSSYQRQSTSEEKSVASRYEQDDMNPPSEYKIESVHHSEGDGSQWCDKAGGKQSHDRQDNLARDSSGRNCGQRSRRSPLLDEMSKLNADDRLDRSVTSRYAVEKSKLHDRSCDVELAFQQEVDRSRERYRSSSIDRHNSLHSQYSLPNVSDYWSERFSVDHDRSSNREKLDRHKESRSRRSLSRSRECSSQIKRDHSSERLREEDRGCSDKRHDSSQDWCCLPSSPSEWNKSSRRNIHSPTPNCRSERSGSRHKRSLSRECSPKYQRHELLRDRNEHWPSSRDAQSRLHSFEKRSSDAYERSPSRSRLDVSYNRSPSRKEQDYSYSRRRSPAFDQDVTSSSVGQDRLMRNRRSVSRDRRFVERHESNRADHSSRSPSQSTASRRRDTPPRGRYRSQEELDRDVRKNHGSLSDRHSQSPVLKRCRGTPGRRSHSRDSRNRRSRSCSRESPSSSSGKYHHGRSDRRGDAVSRRDSSSPDSRTLRESKHSNRDIVQFLMDTGIIAPSKSDSKCRNSGSTVNIPDAKLPVASTSVLSAEPVASSVVAVTQVTTLSSSSVLPSYPVVPPQGLLPTPIVTPVPFVDNSSVPYMPCNPYPAAFPTAAPNLWYPPPGMQACGTFPNRPLVPYHVVQPVPAMPGVGPGPPCAPQQCVVPPVRPASTQDWHGPYAQTYNILQEPGNQSSSRQKEDRIFIPQTTFGADTKGAANRTCSTDRPKRPHLSASRALIKAIDESAVWIPTVDTSTSKAASCRVSDSKASVLSDGVPANKTNSEISVADSPGLTESSATMPVCEKAVEQLQAVSDASSEVQTLSPGCLWECIPEITVDAKSLAVMEANSEVEGLAVMESDGKGRKRRRGQSAADDDKTRRRSSRLRSKEEQKKTDKVDDDGKDQLPLLASKSVTEVEDSKPPVKNLKARILQDFESDAGNPNLSSDSGTTDASIDLTASTNSVTDALCKIPVDPSNLMVTKPEKVKSRWRRWSELETDGEQDRVPPPLPPSQSPSSTTATSVAEVKDVADEKPPYFEPILDNIFLSLRSVTLQCTRREILTAWLELKPTK